MANRKKSRERAQATQSPTPVVGGLLRPPLVGGVGLVAAIVVVVGAILLLSGGGGDTKPATKTAVIVDQLSLTQPNPDFTARVRGLLEPAGYDVDYVPGEQVTVDYYRTLAERGYDLVLLRVHAGITTEVSLESGERAETEYVSLFTGEPYDEKKYPTEQLDRLGRARYDQNSDPLFGIGPLFIEQTMQGDFNNAVVVMMGCDGLRSQRTGEAFLQKGASAFVSWSNQVSAPHTDAATQKLLEKLLIETLSVEEAVAQTAAEVGPDPTYDAELRVLTSGS